MNSVKNKTFGELYKDTMEREDKLKKMGYKVISIWEADWREQNKRK